MCCLLCEMQGRKRHTFGPLDAYNLEGEIRRGHM